MNGVFAEERILNMIRSLPDFDKLRHEEERLRTFYDWPHSDWPASAQNTPKRLAHAGFFYTGSRDRVQCAFCRGFIDKWVQTDSPTTEHIRQLGSQCSSLKGAEPIASGNIRRNENGEQSLPPVTHVRQAEEAVTTTGQITAAAGPFRVELQEVKAREDTAAVRVIIDIGFDRNLVKITIENRPVTNEEGATLHASASSMPRSSATAAVPMETSRPEDEGRESLEYAEENRRLREARKNE